MECKNCYQELSEDSDYCNKCGAKVIRNRLTFKNLFEHVSETFFNYDNKLLRTFIDLFKKPEDVIVGYIDGIRKRYVNVFSYFALAITISGLQIYIMQNFVTDMTFYDLSTDTGKQQQAMFEKVYGFTTEYQSLVMMLYIPFYAIIARLVFLKNKTFNYTELLVVFLYTQAQISIALGIITIIVIPSGLISFPILGLVVMPLQFIYFTYCLKRVYGLTKMQMFIKTLIFLAIIAIVFILIIIGGIVMAIKSGYMEQAIEAQKAARDSLQ